MTRLTTDDRARQGPSGRPVLWVLIGAMTLCALATIGFMLWAGSESPDHASQNASRESVTGSTSGSSNANPTDRISPANPAYPVPANPTANSTNRP